MCAGAMVLARIKRLVYGADDPKAGAAGSIFNALDHPALNHRPVAHAGLMATRPRRSARTSSRPDGDSDHGDGGRQADVAEGKGYAVYWAAAGIVKPRATSSFLRERRQVDQEWDAEQRRETAHPSRLAGLGTAKTLSVLPLVEFYTADERLAGEPGVSYLVTVDGMKILFDTGRNVREEHPSPLLRNMESLGLSPTDIDAVFISHCHPDHVGGHRADAPANVLLVGPAGGPDG